MRVSAGKSHELPDPAPTVFPAEGIADPEVPSADTSNSIHILYNTWCAYFRPLGHTLQHRVRIPPAPHSNKLNKCHIKFKLLCSTLCALNSQRALLGKKRCRRPKPSPASPVNLIALLSPRQFGAPIRILSSIDVENVRCENLDVIADVRDHRVRG